MKKEERLQKQREKLAEMKQREDELHRQGYRYIAGVDEVGRGPLAGPVVTAAVVLPEDFDLLGVDDSKKLSEKRREELYELIVDRALAWGTGICDHQIIDDINILQATKAAMRQAIDNCEKNLGEPLDYVILDALELEKLDRPQEGVVRADSRILAVAAASIVAKVTRDRMMVEYAEKYPGYAFEKNKGYGTAAHYEGIREYGTCPIHRMTFLKNMK